MTSIKSLVKLISEESTVKLTSEESTVKIISNVQLLNDLFCFSVYFCDWIAFSHVYFLWQSNLTNILWQAEGNNHYHIIFLTRKSKPWALGNIDLNGEMHENHTLNLFILVSISSSVILLYFYTFIFLKATFIFAILN